VFYMSKGASEIKINYKKKRKIEHNLLAYCSGTLFRNQGPFYHEFYA